MVKNIQYDELRPSEASRNPVVAILILFDYSCVDYKGPSYTEIILDVTQQIWLEMTIFPFPSFFFFIPNHT